MKFRCFLKAVYRFALFFLVVSFIASCCITLFVYTLSQSVGFALTDENIHAAAKITMLNVLLLSLILTIADSLRRKITVERPAQAIIDAGHKLMAGDFSVRISKAKTFDPDNRFGEIGECFNRMAQELSATETLRTHFVSNVSHELKTPLAVMGNYATLLQTPGLPEEKRLEYANAISDATRRLAALITNILKLNKLENQQITPKFEEYDLSEQLCQCLLGFEDVWEKKGLQIETDIADGIIVSSDGEMMALVWNNLFSNAMKFTEIGGTVSLSLQPDGGDAVVKISDTGCGISPQVGRHIFDKFYQGDTSHATEGNGLGLALVKRVIDITGSDISVESEVGKGTVFTVRMHRRCL